MVSKSSQNLPKYSFLLSKGKVSDVILNKDWSKHELGDPKRWPQSLKTTLSILLNSKFPMFLFWGAHAIYFFNEAFQENLNFSKNSLALLGERGEKALGQSWIAIEALIRQVKLGKGATLNEDEFFQVLQNGKKRDVYLTFSYSPVIDESKTISGVFVTATETTNRIEINQQLLKSKEELEFTIKAANIGTFDFNPQTQVYTVNDTINEWFGFGERNNEGIKLEKAIEAIHPKDRERVKNTIKESLSFTSDGNYAIEYTIINQLNKKKVLIRAKAKVIFNEKGEPIHFSGTMQDITVAKRLEASLIENEERFRNLADKSPMWVWMADNNLDITYANQELLSFIGLNHFSDFTGKTWETIVHPNDIHIVYEIFSNAIKNKEALSIEIRIKNASNLHYSWFLIKGVPRFEMNQLVGFIGTGLNIQEQKNQLRNIEKRSKMFRQLSELMPEKLTKINSKGQVIHYNKSWLDYTGVTLEESLAGGMVKFIHPEDVTEVLTAWCDCLERGVNFEKEYRILNRNNIYKWHLGRIIPIKNKNNEVLEWIGTTTEIHKIKEEEERKSNFIKLVSHEIKTPLTSIKGYIQILLYMVEGKKLIDLEKLPVESSLQRIDAQIIRLTRIIEEMLDLSRLEEAKLELNLQHTNLNELIDHTIEDLTYIFPAANIEVNHNYRMHLKIDRGRMQQVIINLVNNAIKYSPHSNKVVLSINAEKNQQVSFSCKDFGIGISPKNLENIFNRFYRVEGDKERNFSGFGIGLFICNEIIKEHGGLIKVESEVGEGSTFKVFLKEDAVKEGI